MTYDPQKRRGYDGVTVINFAVCRDAARCAGLSATAELLVNTFYCSVLLDIVRKC